MIKVRRIYGDWLNEIIGWFREIRMRVWIGALCISVLILCTLMPVQTGWSNADLFLSCLSPALAVVGIIMLLISLCSRTSAEKTDLRFSWIDGIVLLWVVCCGLRIWIDSVYPVAGFALRGVLLFSLYVSLRLLFSSYADANTGRLVAVLIIIGAVCETIMGVTQIIEGESRHPLYIVTGSFLNPGPYSAYLNLGLVITCCLWHRSWDGATKILGKKTDDFFWVLILIFTTTLCLTMSRAAFLSAAVCLAIIFWDNIRRWRWYLLGVVAIVGRWLYFLKAGSADSRYIINYMGLRCMGEHPFLGSGIGSFVNRFAEAIAGVSESNPDFNLLRADVIEAPFNDLLGVGVEQGIVGLALVLAGIVSVLVRLWRRSMPLCIGFLSLIIFSLFSYPFRLLPFQIITVVMVAYAATPSKGGILPGCRYWTVVFCSAISVLVLSVVARECIKERAKAETDYHLISVMDDVAFIDDYYELLPLMRGNKRFLFDFAKLLATYNRFSDSNAMLRLGTLVSNDPMFYVLQGNNYSETGDYEEAERAYKKAFAIMPNRLYPLYRLMSLYWMLGEWDTACEYAVHVRDFKEKVPSPAVAHMKDSAENIIGLMRAKPH